MTNTNLLSAALLSVVGLAGAAQGAIIINPPYTDAMSTLQCWDFLTPANPSPADPGFNNPNGTPIMHANGSPNWLQGQFNKSGVWQLNPNAAGTGDSLDFLVPNSPDTTHQKLIWLEVKYFGFPGSVFLPPVVSGGAAGPAPNEPVTWTGRTTRPSDNSPDWSIDTWVGYLNQCPAAEILSVGANPGASTPTLIDYVCINTTCVPTPGGGALLAAGALVLGVRRRRV